MRLSMAPQDKCYSRCQSGSCIQSGAKFETNKDVADNFFLFLVNMIQMQTRHIHSNPAFLHAFVPGYRSYSQTRCSTRAPQLINMAVLCCVVLCCVALTPAADLVTHIWKASQENLRGCEVCAVVIFTSLQSWKCHSRSPVPQPFTCSIQTSPFAFIWVRLCKHTLGSTLRSRRETLLPQTCRLGRKCCTLPNFCPFLPGTALHCSFSPKIAPNKLTGESS